MKSKYLKSYSHGTSASLDVDINDEENSDITGTAEYQDVVDKINELLVSVAANKYADLHACDLIKHTAVSTKDAECSARGKVGRLIKEQLDARLLDARLIQPSTSPLSSPILLVVKPTGACA